jgi:hypothetical protein
VAPTDKGAVLWLDGGETPIELLLTIPTLIADELETLGVTDGRVGVPSPPKLFDAFDRAERWATLRLFAAPPAIHPPLTSAVPSDWVAAASDWLGRETIGREHLTVTTLTTQWRVDKGGAQACIQRAHDRRASNVYLIAGDPRNEAAIVQGYFEFGNIAMSIVGPSRTPEDFLAGVERLKQVARQLAPALGYACVSVNPQRAGNLGSVPAVDLNEGTDRHGVDRYPSSLWTSWLCDEAVFDAYHYQVLGPGHLHRLGAAAAGLPIHPLAGGRVEATLGTVADWLETDVLRERVLRRGRRDLAPCLLTYGEASDLLDARRAPASA